MIRRSPVPLRTVALLSIAAAIVLAPAAGAAADPRGGDSRAARGAVLNLGFKIVSRNGEAVKVKDFEFSGLRLNCAEGPATFKLTKPLPDMRISERRRFSGSFGVQGIRVRVQGKFKRSFKKARGIVRAQGDADGFTDCRSGPVDWKAS